MWYRPFLNCCVSLSWSIAAFSSVVKDGSAASLIPSVSRSQNFRWRLSTVSSSVTWLVWYVRLKWDWDLRRNSSSRVGPKQTQPRFVSRATGSFGWLPQISFNAWGNIGLSPLYCERRYCCRCGHLWAVVSVGNSVWRHKWLGFSFCNSGFQMVFCCLDRLVNLRRNFLNFFLEGLYDRISVNFFFTFFTKGNCFFQTADYIFLIISYSDLTLLRSGCLSYLQGSHRVDPQEVHSVDSLL